VVQQSSERYLWKSWINQYQIEHRQVELAFDSIVEKAFPNWLAVS